MLLKHPLRLLIGKSTGRAELLIHSLQVIKKGSADILPQNTLLPVEYISAAFRLVDVFQIVGEDECAFVVDPYGRIKVIGQKYDLFLHSGPPLRC